MAAEVWTAVIGGVAGLASGTVASLTAPWANWSIEKRRIDRQRRYDLLDSWRDGIALLGDDHTEALESHWYETLRPYLTKAMIDRLEAQRTFIVPPENGRGAKGLFTGEVDRIEREWGLRP